MERGCVRKFLSAVHVGRSSPLFAGFNRSRNVQLDVSHTTYEMVHKRLDAGKYFGDSAKDPPQSLLSDHAVKQ